MIRKRRVGKWLAGAVLAAAAIGLWPSDAHACGGFFCSAVQPVNQAAERIIFAENGDGTVTAVIQIMYQGPSESFSWLLPISTVPGDDDIGVASDLAFQRLQTATNPQYTLTTRVEGTCKAVNTGGASSGGASAAGGSTSFPGMGSGGSAGSAGVPPVTVEASGVVGAFEWTVISLNPDLENPADAAVEWLGDNGYDVSPGSPELLGPYLADGLYLLALRLTKGSDAGSIRPIVLTYDADQPMIPIKLTSVAANDNMGVMTWVLSSSRAIPYNYLSLELNEARINWFNAGLTYNNLVIEAADDAGGQGFVTEFAGASSQLSNVVWTQNDEAIWQQYQSGVFQNFDQIFNAVNSQYGQWDGFWDAIEEAITLPDGVAFEDFKICPSCYQGQLSFSPSELFASIEKHVIAPVRDVQALIDDHDYTTRFYTTMSAAEMTLDPVFGFNEELGDLSNLHSAERVVECSSDYYLSEAPWRIELPQGGLVRGLGSGMVGTWPAVTAEQPSNFRIVQAAESGPGAVLEDNADQIQTMLDDYNDSLGIPNPGGGGTPSTGGSSSGGGTTGGTTTGGNTTGGTTTGGTTTGGTTTGGNTTGGSTGTGGDAGSPDGGSGDNDADASDKSDSGGCSVAGSRDTSSLWALAMVLGAAFTRRRRRPV